MGRRFSEILAAKWWGVLGRSWNSERPLVFSQVVLKKTLGVHWAREILAWITLCIDLWERGLHTGLVGNAEAEGAVGEVISASGSEEKDEAVARSIPDNTVSW